MKIFFAALLIAQSLIVNAQPGLLWSESIESGLNDYYSDQPTVSIISDTIRVVGAKSTPQGERLLIVDYNLNGDTLLTKEYGNDTTERSEIVDYQVTDSTVYLLKHNYLEFYKSIIVLQKYNKDGDLMWGHQIQSEADTSFSPHALAIINDTCLLITGYKEYDYPEEGDDVINTTTLPQAYAFNFQGDIIWQREFNTATEIHSLYFPIIVLEELVYLFEFNQGAMRMLKIGADNMLYLFENIGLTHGIQIIQQTEDNQHLIVTGGDYISKIDINGNQNWSTVYKEESTDGRNSSAIEAIVQDDEANIYITGRYYQDSLGSIDYNNADILTIKLDKDGNKLWENRYAYNGNNVDQGNTIVPKNGFVYVGGSSQSAGVESEYDYVVLKLNAQTGDNAGTYRYSGSGLGDDEISSLAIFNNGNVVLTGLSFGTGGYNWLTQMLSDVITNSIEESSINPNFIYPNPVNNQIHFSNTLAKIRSVRIIDSSGKTVLQYNNPETNSIDVSVLKPGNYLLNLVTEQQNGLTFKFEKLANH